MSSDKNESANGEYTRDLFVSYATEDIELVESLVNRLRKEKYEVWFDKHDMIVTGDLPRILEEALQQCRQVLICLSDQYCAKEYTQLEMKLNFLMDPVNLRGRSIPVLIHPLTNPVPTEVRIIPWIDLTKPERYEAEFARLKASILSPQTPQLPKFATPVEVEALQKLDDPDKIQVQAMRYAKEIYIYIHGKEIGGQCPRDLAGLAKSLTEWDKLPWVVRSHIETIQKYISLLEGPKEEQWAIEPGLHALLALSKWVYAHYNLPMADPFMAFWSQMAKQLPTEDFPYRLAAGNRRITPMGAVYEGQEHIDGAAVDLVVAPLSGSSEYFTQEVTWCMTEDSPIQARAYKVIETGAGEWWGLVALGRPEGSGLAAIGKAVSTVPRLAAALIRQVGRAFQESRRHARILSESFFRAENLLVDNEGLLRLAWNWEALHDSDTQMPGSEDLQREKFSFCHRRGSIAADMDTWIALRNSLAEAVKECMDESLRKGIETAKSPNEAVQAANSVTGDEAEDSEMLRSTVEAIRENRRPVAWEKPKEEELTKDEGDEPKSPDKESRELPKAGLTLQVRLPFVCQRGWPLGRDCVLLQDMSGHLAVWHADKEQPDSTSNQPFRFRRAALSSEGHVALGSWDGEVCWFHADGKRKGACSLGGPVGDLQWHGKHLIAGAWNGRLISAAWDKITELLKVTDGVRRIAVSSGDSFAALSMSGSVSVYRGAQRKIQIVPIYDVIDIAYADKRLVLLTQSGLVTVAEDGMLSNPDQPPAGRMLHLMSDPAEKRCLMVDSDGISWTVDAMGTYPRSDRLPCGKRLMTASRGLKKIIAPSPQGGFAYWRKSKIQRSWFEAMSANISYDGRRIVVLLPDVVEIYEDAE